MGYLNNTYIKKNQAGAILVTVMAMSFIFLVMFIGAINLALMQLKLNKAKTAQAQALQIAEAGVNYYRWVLYHDEEHYFDTLGCDFDVDCDVGTSTYNDPFNPGSDGVKGKYHLSVRTPQKNGSSVVVVSATGWSDEYPKVKKILEVGIGKKSWSAYSILSNSNLEINTGYDIYGEIHSNAGVRVDGVAHNLVTSSLKKYFDKNHCGAEEYGVHSHTYEVNDGCDCPTDPNDCDSTERYDDAQFLAGDMPNNYPNVFRAGRSFPVPPVSFNVLNDHLSGMISMAADTDGQIIDPSILGCDADSTCSEGFRIILNNNNFSVDKVESTNCDGYAYNQTHSYGNIDYPANGLVLVRGRDKVWIEGNLDDTRVTIMAFNGAIDEGNTDIIITNNIIYAHDNGSEALGLIAQRNILVDKCISGNDLQVDAAMITKKGEILANYVDPVKNNLQIYGSIATYGGFSFYENISKTCSCWKLCCLWNCPDPCGSGTSCGSYDCSEVNGYSDVDINYDPNLTFNPPPHYPTTGEYSFISWNER